MKKEWNHESLAEFGEIRMTSPLRLWCMALLLAVAAAPVPSLAAERAQTPSPDARCQVWARELSFAQSVLDHDAAAFAAHLHPQAAFGVSGKPTLGRAAIAEEWAGIIDGSALSLDWYPSVVTIGGDGETAYSSGPALYQDPKTGAARLGRFGSVWQRGGDGSWYVIFDDGIRPEPADAAAVQAFRQGRRADCPPA
ncbi:Ketosteroid isomerase homolog [Pseudoxanthomonas wuyuanensis]|uniref:Ketosteroid isomerase homolog n=2 Tax=Pseudoxanthomonas wuyuanensis TaxID=1073196 RepID=A0A286D7B8_9GAMM|nr:Ketosteroid isomerase homolog [Pseudoxanthomonas wuyuanensis]